MKLKQIQYINMLEYIVHTAKRGDVIDFMDMIHYMNKYHEWDSIRLVKSVSSIYLRIRLYHQLQTLKVLG